MTARGTDNLQGYLRETTLPVMKNDPNGPDNPPRGHKSHKNHLQVQSQATRRLKDIYNFTNESLFEAVTSYSNVPNTSVGIEDEDPVTGEKLSIASESPVFSIPFHNERRPSDMMRTQNWKVTVTNTKMVQFTTLRHPSPEPLVVIVQLTPWLDNLPLMTVQRTIHILYPDSYPWEFRLCDDDDNDRKMFQYFMWSGPVPHEGMALDIDHKSVLVAFQPPWILSEQDIKEFSQCRSFPPFRVPGNAFPTRFGEQGAIIWDAWVAKNTRWFVLTSYNQWVFGVFSNGEFYLSLGILKYSHLYILARMDSSLRHSLIPKVPEPVSLGPVFIHPNGNANFATPANSESNWDGKSQDAPTSVGARSMSFIFTNGGLPRQLGDPLGHQGIQEWQSAVDFDAVMPDIPPRVPSPARDDIFEQPLTYHGNWLA
ncbi:hypothetical protein DFH06DRAFT_1131068 [Mycena polygramma]|nr:hypothetical protein DFH06DRAFT_1131068 [Mycena polygramma]